MQRLIDEYIACESAEYLEWKSPTEVEGDGRVAGVTVGNGRESRLD